MSEYKVPITTIKEILPHGNADSLEVAKVYDFEVIVRKDTYRAGDVILYIPIESIIPEWLETRLFGPDSKIKLNNRRVKQIKIRSRYSQGMIVDLKDVADHLTADPKLETDVKEELGIVKYEPPQASYQNSGQQKRDKPKENPYFHKYGGIDNLKWFPDLFKEGEEVNITEKIHGSNIRFGYVPYVANNLWRKFLKLIGLAPKWEWVYGSNNVQLQQRWGYSGYYGEDVYGKVLEKYQAKDKVQPGEIWYGELYGDGIQKNYTYGCKNGEHKLVVFDLKIQNGVDDSHFADVQTFKRAAKQRGFEVVPTLFEGSFNKEEAKKLTVGDSVFVPSQKVREGVVIKSMTEPEHGLGRKLLKLISEEYLSRDQSEFH